MNKFELNIQALYCMKPIKVMVDKIFFIKLSKKVTASQIRSLQAKIQGAVGNCVDSFMMILSKDLWGFQNNEEFHFMHLNFKNLLF